MPAIIDDDVKIAFWVGCVGLCDPPAYDGWVALVAKDCVDAVQPALRILCTCVARARLSLVSHPNLGRREQKRPQLGVAAPCDGATRVVSLVAANANLK